jgi:hypothetical protein
MKKGSPKRLGATCTENAWHARSLRIGASNTETQTETSKNREREEAINLWFEFLAQCKIYSSVILAKSTNLGITTISGTLIFPQRQRERMRKQDTQREREREREREGCGKRERRVVREDTETGHENEREELVER